jgi:hypothetical protein
VTAAELVFVRKVMHRAMSAMLAGALVLVPMTPPPRAEEKLIEPLVPGWERFFRLEWEVAQAGRRPVVRGYVVNSSPYTVIRMQLLLDVLDGGDRVVAQRTSWVVGALAAFSRVPFEIPAPQGQAYRVRVLAYERLETMWRQAP